MPQTSSGTQDGGYLYPRTDDPPQITPMAPTSLWKTEIYKSLEIQKSHIGKASRACFSWGMSNYFIYRHTNQNQTNSSIQCLKTSMSTEEKSAAEMLRIIMLRMVFVIALEYCFLLATQQKSRWRRAEYVTPKWTTLAHWLFWIKVT